MPEVPKVLRAPKLAGRQLKKDSLDFSWFLKVLKVPKVSRMRQVHKMLRVLKVCKAQRVLEVPKGAKVPTVPKGTQGA